MWRMVREYDLERHVERVLQSYTTDFVLDCHKRGCVDILRILDGRQFGDCMSERLFEEICQQMKFVTRRNEWDHWWRRHITGVYEAGVQRRLNDSEVLVTKLLGLRYI